MTVKGICASRGPRSRTATFLVRVSLFSGLCLGVMVGGATAASAAEHAHADKPSLAQPASSNESDSGEKASGSETKSSGKAKPAGKSSKPAEKASRLKADSDESEPAQPENAQPDQPTKAEPAKPAEVEPAKPAEVEPAKPAKPEVPAPAEPEINAPGSGDTPAHAEANASAHAIAASEGDQDRPAKANGARHHAPAVAHGQPKAPTPDLVGMSVARQAVKVPGRSTAPDDAQPRAPDADGTPDVEPPSDPGPAAPAPCAPPPGSLTSASAGSIGGLRNAHAILPSSPDLSDTGATVVAQRDIGPDISIRSVETTASPD
ncbi:hypothetical protein [Saccharopolyspora mangrovi]|uniref:Uncharacterized protein n=1 Tax=Saccharopolyspora mangrovi TaxID=3082379 RepID=A0ABU6AFH4_9PSEU|nr:hypothetical protein [Saccharopolyspora sp. S2-29]MEB3370265.1 hypothetical protein [Saccharopolyspora sp. S2-29]